MPDTKTPLLSVVIPVFNGEEYVGTMIDCFRAQEGDDFELIFVDDGSTDASVGMLHSYQRTEAFPITVVEQGPRGVSSARNAGLDRVRGQYLSFVDVDDRITSDYMSVLRAALEKEGGFDLLFFRSERVTPKGPFKAAGGYSGSVPKTSKEMLELIGQDPTKFGVYNMFLSADFVKKEALRFTEGYPYYEDYDYLFRAAALADTIFYCPDRLYFYLLQEGSAVATFPLSRVTSIELLERLVPWLQLHAPDFVPFYVRFVLSRIWWSVLWQSCLAFSLKDWMAFAKASGVRERMKILMTCGDTKVSGSATLFLLMPPGFYAAANAAGKRRSKIGRTDVRPFLDYFQK